MSTVYGPVPSWRLGRSLGIDVVLPPKKCTFNCVYCQLGKTSVHVSNPKVLQGKLVDAETVRRDLDDVLKRLDISTIDVVTFSGSGEPTLNLELGKIAGTVKERIGDVPLAVLTNSSLFYKEKVRENLASFDIVVAKLDAGDNTTFHAINRPVDVALNVKTVMSSIEKVKHTVKSALALEVMLLRSVDNRVTNVEGKPLQALLDAIIKVNPDQVQLGVPYRPPSESFVEIPSQEEVELVFEGLAKHFERNQLRVYGFYDEHGKDVRWLFHKSLEREAIELLERRPCSVVDVSKSLGISLSTVANLLERLVSENLVAVEVRKGEKYYLKREDLRST
ncbi:radical SAM protein [Candidatus Bathyarchaeota archaeon]|nr:radical SAM protein [Candidatus Bathyarchaeota archaeon]